MSKLQIRKTGDQKLKTEPPSSAAYPKSPFGHNFIQIIDLKSNKLKLEL